MLPLVSVLTPTFNRPELLRRALRLFLAYKYPRKEWIVVDDSPEPATGIQGPGIRYVHLKDRMVLGAKHNLAASLAQGEILVHRDDDDLCSPESLMLQVDAIAAKGYQLAGFRMSYVRDERTGAFFKFRRGRRGKPTNQTLVPVYGFHDSNAAFRREIWDEGIQYSLGNVGEKLHLLNDAIRAGYSWTALEAGEHFVFSHHANNTWRFRETALGPVPAPGFSTYGWFAAAVRRAA